MRTEEVDALIVTNDGLERSLAQAGGEHARGQGWAS